MITQAHVNFTEDGPANAACRPLDRGWRERHIRWQAEGRIPPGKTPLLYEDGTPVLDRIGRQRWWSMHVEAATRPRPADGWLRPPAPGSVPGARAPEASAPRVPVGRAACRAVPAADPRVVTALISRIPPAPVKRPPSSRTLARMREKAAEQARNAEAARALRAQVQPGLRPSAGRLFGVDVAGMLLRGPLGGIGTSERMSRTLAPLAAGGRHPAEVLMTAGAWQTEEALREALAAIGGKLAAIGLRVDRRKAGIRMVKLSGIK